MTRVFVETGELTPPFDTFHPFEEQSKNHEKRVWFNGRSPPFKDVADTEFFPSLSQPEAISAMTAARPEAMLVFGTRKLNKSVIDVCPSAAFNIHTGNPEQYRGLDAHLWAIYHRDFEALSVAMQRLATELDRGDMLGMENVILKPGMRLFQLRAAGTEAAVELSRRILASLQHDHALESRPLQTVGRYYSFMPSVLKELCIKRFEKFTSRL